jgi:hypothetical protein
LTDGNCKKAAKVAETIDEKLRKVGLPKKF